MKLSTEYEALFSEVIRAAAATGRRTSKLAPGWPGFGVRYRLGKSLMVIGRAINGLQGCGFYPGTLSVQELKNVAVGAREYGENPNHAENPDCRMPLAWIDSDEPYKKKGGGTVGSKSAFWRVTKQIHSKLGLAPKDDERWWMSIGWSNLYKVAPMNGGNPGVRLQRAQRAHAGQLLAREIHEARPAYVLLITGGDWYDEVRSADPSLLPELKAYDGGDHVVRSGAIGTARWVMTKRPEGHREREFAGEVIRAFQS